jgi:8-oxo-dGTP pyrophosphatase MutT (NUDIX family)
MMYDYFDLDFDSIWINGWSLGKTNPSYERIYEKSKDVFNTFFLPNCRTLLEYYSDFHLLENEWEIPRGKKNFWEKPIECAMREFEEETGISKHKLIHKKYIKCVYETLIGSNDLKYKFNYYTMELKNKERVYVSSEIYEQHTEIRNVSWILYDDIMDKCKYVYPNRYKLLMELRYGILMDEKI